MTSTIGARPGPRCLPLGRFVQALARSSGASGRLVPMPAPEPAETTAELDPHAERCLRCAAWMEWRHGTWQCPRCRFKIGCCEGPTGECFPDR